MNTPTIKSHLNTMRHQLVEAHSEVSFEIKHELGAIIPARTKLTNLRELQMHLTDAEARVGFCLSQIDKLEARP